MPGPELTGHGAAPVKVSWALVYDALHPRAALPRRHRPRRGDPPAAGPGEQPGVPCGFDRRRPERVDRGPPHAGDPGLAGGVVDLQARVLGAREQVAVLGPLVARCRHHGLPLGDGLFEDRRLGLDVGPRQLCLALAPAGRDDPRAVVVDHAHVGVERSRPRVGADVNLETHARGHADDHVDVEGGFALSRTTVGVRPVHADPTHRCRDGRRVAILEGVHVGGQEGLELVDAHRHPRPLRAGIEARERIGLGQVIGGDRAGVGAVGPDGVLAPRRGNGPVGVRHRGARDHGVRDHGVRGGTDQLRHGAAQIVETRHSGQVAGQVTRDQGLGVRDAHDLARRQADLLEPHVEGLTHLVRAAPDRYDQAVARRRPDRQAPRSQPSPHRRDGGGERSEHSGEFAGAEIVPERRGARGGHRGVERLQRGRVTRFEHDVGADLRRPRHGTQHPAPLGESGHARTVAHPGAQPRSGGRRGARPGRAHEDH